MAFIQVDGLKVNSGDAKMAGIGAALTAAGDRLGTWAQSKYEAEMREYAEKRKAAVDMTKLKFDSAQTQLMAEQQYQDAKNQSVVSNAFLDALHYIPPATTDASSEKPSEKPSESLTESQKTISEISNIKPELKTSENIAAPFGQELAGQPGKTDATPLSVGYLQGGIPYLSSEKDAHGSPVTKRWYATPNDIKLIKGALMLDATKNLSIDKKIANQITMPKEAYDQYGITTYEKNITQVNEQMKFKDVKEKENYYQEQMEVSGSAFMPNGQNDGTFYIGKTAESKKSLKAKYELQKQVTEAAINAHKDTTPLTKSTSTNLFTSGGAGGDGLSNTQQKGNANEKTKLNEDLKGLVTLKTDLMGKVLQEKSFTLVTDGYQETLAEDINSTPLPAIIVSQIQEANKDFIPKESYTRKEFYKLAQQYNITPSKLLNPDRAKTLRDDEAVRDQSFTLASEYLRYMSAMGSPSKSKVGDNGQAALSQNTITSRSSSFYGDLTKEQAARTVQEQLQLEQAQNKLNAVDQSAIDAYKFAEFKAFTENPHFRDDFRAKVVVDGTGQIETISGLQMKEFVKTHQEKMDKEKQQKEEDAKKKK